jgi:outer membrane protein OmpA-like peptidoglycan-associated protein
VVTVKQVRVSLSRFGPGISRALLDEPSPAKIAFKVASLEQARGPSVSSTALGSISGTLSFRVDGVPEFVVEEATGFDAPATPAASRSVQQRPRFLDLELDPGQFIGPLLLQPEPVRIFLETELLETVSHFELSAELSIGGGPEAAFEGNDVLDVPRLPTPIARVRLVDELGEPIASEKVILHVGDESVALTTDEHGAAAIINPPVPIIDVELPDFDGLVKRLKPRWDRVRPGRRLVAGERVRVISLTEEPEPVGVGEGTTLLSVQPRVVEARVTGMFFDTNKAFLLPSAILGMRGMKRFNDENPDAVLLVVGHADTAGSPAYNDKLSLERAESVAAFLTDQADKWLKFYDASDEKKRWGDLEDQAMLSALPDAATLVSSADPISSFQQARGLKVDGIAGPQTRKQLVKEYMALDGTTLPAGTKIVTHGCGENFLADPTADGVADQANRRAELLFFDKKLGIQPPPQGQNSGPNSTDYPEWKRRSQETRQFDASLKRVQLRLLDASDQPLVGVAWVLEHATGAIAGKTLDDGLVSAAVPISATEATLKFEEQVVTLTLLDADFPPATQPDGAQLRLSNLGYQPGDDDTSSDFTQALREFQTDHQLTVNGVLDPATSDKLTAVYGS